MRRPTQPVAVLVFLLPASMILIPGCKRDRPADAAPAIAQQAAHPAPNLMDELMGIEWRFEDGDQHAFNELQGMPDDELRRRGCTRKCVRATDAHEPGFPTDPPSGPFTDCSRQCLESLLPPAWKAFWNRNIPDSIKRDVKPFLISHWSRYEFFPDSVVFQADSTMGVCSKWDESVFNQSYSSDLKMSRRIAYRKWEIRNDSIYLRDGMAHTTLTYPYKSWGTIMQSSAPVLDRAGEFRLRSEGYSWRQNKGRRKVLHLLGLTAYEPISMGL